MAARRKDREDGVRLDLLGDADAGDLLDGVWRAARPSRSRGRRCGATGRREAGRRTGRRRSASSRRAGAIACGRTGSPSASSGARKTTASPSSRPFLVPPNERMSTPASVVRSRSGRSSAGGGVGEPRAVDVEQHAALVGEVGERADLVGRVHGAELGGVGDRYDARLGGVLVAYPDRCAGAPRRARG